MFAGTVHDPKDLIGATVFEMLSQTFGKFETGLIHLRTMEGNARRKATGGFTGRTPLLDAKRQAKLFDLHSRREHSIAELAEMFNLSKPGVYKYVAREKNLRSEPGSSSTT